MILQDNTDVCECVVLRQSKLTKEKKLQQQETRAHPKRKETWFGIFTA